MLRSFVVLTSVCAAYAAVLPRDALNGVHLAVDPKCGVAGGRFGDVNIGLKPLTSYEHIVAFGDSWTDGGAHDGEPLPPPVLTPPNPRAGGRASNGPVWVEKLASAAGATLLDFAEIGAVTDKNIWPSSLLPTTASSANDFVGQAHNYINQRNGFDPETTLYTIFLGVGDFDLSQQTGTDNLYTVAGAIVYTILELTSYPTYAKNIIVVDNYGRGIYETPSGDAFKEGIYAGLNTLHTRYGTSVGFVDLKTLWDGVLGSSPGYEAFGYTSKAACLPSSTSTSGACANPESTFYWLPGIPSAATHGLIADYVAKVLATC
ncbi:SGNH hydrolase superfamily protein [Pleurotus pulmonarius]|nr:hypothetical protein EYR36_007993 [Pleurotus pulmonarius]